MGLGGNRGAWGEPIEAMTVTCHGGRRLGVLVITNRGLLRIGLEFAAAALGVAVALSHRALGLGDLHVMVLLIGAGSLELRQLLGLSDELVSSCLLFVAGVVLGEMIHEAGHACMARLLGYSVEGIYVTGKSSAIHWGRPSRTMEARHVLLVALAGPAANAAAALMLTVWAAVDGASTLLELCILSQIVSAVFNLVPFRTAGTETEVSCPALGIRQSASDGYWALQVVRRGTRRTVNQILEAQHS